MIVTTPKLASKERDFWGVFMGGRGNVGRGKREGSGRVEGGGRVNGIPQPLY